MNQLEVKIPFGRHLSGKVIHINNAENGKKCDCICLQCGNPLIAVQSKSIPIKRRWHFSHDTNSSCNGMSVLHAVAQDILYSMAGKGYLKLPPFETSLSAELLNGDMLKKDIVISCKRFFLSKVLLEKKIGSHINDAVCINENGEKLLVEVFVKHKKTEDDIRAFRRQRITCIEIDLSDLPWDSSYEDIKSIIVNELANKSFLHNEISEDVRLEFEQEKKRKNNELLNCLNIELSWIYKKLQSGFETSFGAVFVLKNHRNETVEVSKFVNLSIKAIQLLDVEPDKIWSVNAVVNNTTNILIVCGISDHQVETYISLNVPPKKAVLSLICHQFDQEGDINLRYSSWHNVGHWAEKISELAKEDLERRGKFSRTNIPSIITQSKQLNQEGLIQALGIASRRYGSTFSNAWNVDEFTWKATIAKYKLLTFKNKKIKIEHICKCDYLHRLFGFTGDTYFERLDEVVRWFAEIEKRGLFIKLDSGYKNKRNVSNSARNSNIWYCLNRPVQIPSGEKLSYHLALD